MLIVFPNHDNSREEQLHRDTSVQAAEDKSTEYILLETLKSFIPTNDTFKQYKSRVTPPSLISLNNLQMPLVVTS